MDKTFACWRLCYIFHWFKVWATAQRQEWLRLLQKFPLSKEVHQELSTQVRSDLENCARRLEIKFTEINPFCFDSSVGNGLNGLPKELVHFPDGAGIYTGSSGLPIHTRLGPMRGRVCAENQVTKALRNFSLELNKRKLSNLWWMPNSLSNGFDTAMKTGSSRRFKRYPTTYRWVSSWLPFTVD